MPSSVNMCDLRLDFIANSSNSLDTAMTIQRQTAHQTFAENFLGLPKELRDLIYTEVFSDLEPVALGDGGINSAGGALFALGGRKLDADLESEVLKAFYTYSTFSVRFLDHQDTRCNDIGGNIRCACPVSWLPQSQYCQYIRNLIIYSQESCLDSDISQVRTLEALEDIYSAHHYRRCFEQLLWLPQIEQLTIKLQKSNNDQFAWPSFTPILSALRQRSPKFRVSLRVSFDDMLESYWYDPRWGNAAELGNVIGHPYDPMGFVDATELMEAPTEEDFAYVKEYCPGEVQTMGRDILRGLLDETASQRKALALHYVVKEPALLRVRIEEHYEVYRKTKQDEMTEVMGVS